ncbi:MAG TPA: hypothetical protein VGP23_04780 [Candidatus Binataceae bacterium]|nr:hypothetical protein [Candidatus Binataceae bacterium]
MKYRITLPPAAGSRCGGRSAAGSPGARLSAGVASVIQNSAAPRPSLSRMLAGGPSIAT